LHRALSRENGEFAFSLPAERDSKVVHELIAAFERWLRLEQWEQSDDGVWLRGAERLRFSTSQDEEMTILLIKRL
jgi:hypothetical protein